MKNRHQFVFLPSVITKWQKGQNQVNTLRNSCVWLLIDNEIWPMRAQEFLQLLTSTINLSHPPPPPPPPPPPHSLLKKTRRCGVV